MKIFVVLSLWVCFFTVVILAQRNGAAYLRPKVGIVNSTPESKVCFSIENSKLKAGQQIRVVFVDKPQSVSTAFIQKKTTTNCSSDISDFTHPSYYWVRIEKHDVFAGIGVVGNQRIKVAKGVATTDLNGDGKKDYFRTCASNEGLHLTIWDGKPLIGKRIWHYYYYLTYDTQFDCKKKDYKE